MNNVTLMMLYKRKDNIWGLLSCDNQELRTVNMNYKFLSIIFKDTGNIKITKKNAQHRTQDCQSTA